MRPYLLLIPASLFCAMPAVSDELPQRKAGLWEIKMVMGGRELPFRNIQQCTDAETDAAMSTNLGGAMGSDCAQPRISNSGGTITMDSTCKIGSSTTSTRAVITGDFDSAYTIAVMPMPAGGAATAGSGAQPHMTMHAKWIGPCLAGQRPGDIIMPGGIKLNIRSLAIGAGTGARP